MKFTRIVTSLAVAALMLLAGCSNIFAPRITARDSGATGTGTVRIDIGGASSSRTLLPAAAGGFTKYDLRFVDQAGQLPPKDVPDYELNAEVTLAEGTWTVTVDAYLSDGVGGDRKAAVGEATVLVVYNKTGETVAVTLRPVDTTATYTGNGTFAWDISFPALTETVTLEISKLDGTVVQTLSLKGGGSTDGTLSEEGDRSEGEIELPAGSYYAQTTLTRGLGANLPKARRQDALFILEGMTTTADANAGYAFTNDNFNRTIYVTSAGNSGPGTLRQALADAANDDVIQVILPQGSVIVLETTLSINNKSLIIEGNGVALTGGNGVMLGINGSNMEFVIRRIHFKDGLGTTQGSAILIQATGSYTLESCVFSGNKSISKIARGGALLNSYGALTVLGCTFYNNTTTGNGGAIYNDNGTVRLGGNVFYGNTANSGGNVVYGSGGTVTSLGYNVSDLPGGSTTDPAGSGFYFLPSDRQFSFNPLSMISFRPYSSSGVLGSVDPSAIGDYPAADFYGDPISETAAAAGAVQIPASDTGSSLRIVTQGSGTLVPGGAVPDSDGLYAYGSQVTLTATPESGWYLARWTINGVKQNGSPDVVILNEDMDVMAVFGRDLQAADESQLRSALSDQRDYDRITLVPGGDETIQINTALPTITKSIVIDGNGATLARNSSEYALLDISGIFAQVVIRRLHFNGGSISVPAPALSYSGGNLSVESSIFSGNQRSDSGGPAIYATGNNAGTLVALGCTFYGNTATSPNANFGRGGAIRLDSFSGDLKLAGNLFYDNSANTYNVVYWNTSNQGAIASLGYNVSDYAGGTDPATGSGFAFAAATDRQDAAGSVSPVSFKPALGSGSLDAVNVSAFNNDNADFVYPTQDFYGNAIPLGAANAGAAQGGGTGYALRVVTRGPGQVTGLPTLDSNGLVAPGISFTLTTTPTTGVDYLVSLTVDGEIQGGNTFPVTSMNKNLKILAVFGGTFQVATEADLIQALADPSCSVISLLPDGVITITGYYLIPRDLIIEGNGATLLYNSNAETFFYITEDTANVSIRRVHFKNAGNGAVYHYTGTLNLESCIFSDNHNTTQSYFGGAITVDGGALNVLGCTFHNNSATDGGAIKINAGAVQLGGNLFYGNIASSTGNVVYRAGGTVTSLGYNVSNYDATGSGFTFISGDKTLTYPTQNPLDVSDPTHPYKPAAASLSDINIVVTSGIQNYPAKDFYGTALSGTVPAGAVMDY
jgi:hypothetical protein